MLKKSFALLMVLAAVAAFGQQAAGLRYSITVSKFENEANWSGRWDLGDAWGTVLTDALMQTGRFIVLGEKDMRKEAMDEQDLAASGRVAQGKMTPQTGKMTPAQLLVKGSITHVQETAGGGGGIGFKGIRIGGDKGSAEINVTIYVVDSQTGQVKASKSVVGKAGQKGVSLGYSGHALGGLTGDLGGFEKDNMGLATADAVNQAVEFLIAQLGSLPWTGSVLLAKEDKITINRGTRDGVAVGMQFDVGSTEILTDPDTGEVLDEELTSVGVIQVTAVKEKVATCKPLSGSGFEKGMSIQPHQAQ
ncbi:MAG: hypothetical protein J6Y80_02225 [Victivallales bacterium]|nr:hypothetical protein [Victivallales bacterium]